MEMTPRISSNIQATGYDAQTKTFYIDFVNGKRYCYQPVSEEVAAGVEDAISIGSYLHKNIISTTPARMLSTGNDSAVD
jgi:hypothetical protein